MSVSTMVLAGRYRLGSRIAGGGVGEVWRGTDEVLVRPVAIKMLRPEFSHHPETLARFRAEARHAGSLTHPAIAQIYDYGDADPGRPAFLVMELVDGQSLADVLAAGPLSPVMTLDVLSQAAAGLAAAHATGLVHRDIKPANLLISADGRVKITDFGIAYAAGSAPLTRTGLVVGTPGYLAPERSAGASATAAADLYSLGVVGYECLTGKPPFTGQPLEVAVAHRDRPLPPLPSAVPGEVAGLVADLTAKDPAARPVSAGQVARRASALHDGLSAAGGAAGLAGGAEGLAGGAAGPAGGAAGPAGGAGEAAADATAMAREAATILPDAATVAPDSTRVLPDAEKLWPTTAAASQDAPSPARPAATWADAPSEPDVMDPTIAGLPVPGVPWRRSRRWTSHSMAAAAWAMAALIALGAWLIAGLGGGTPPKAAATSASRAHADRLVEVTSAGLIGQPVRVARARLRALGMQVRVAWQGNGPAADGQPGGDAAGGTVVAVRPTGRLPAGTTVALTAVRAPAKKPGQGSGDGQGHGPPGPGNGNGNGND
ncbi:MAG TPA: serine/threonine-protein kinase [Streptosporangiaceae bacterium]|nr:serine/threonine-protein kinase [Streptosporangiaceae bacterium]